MTWSLVTRTEAGWNAYREKEEHEEVEDFVIHAGNGEHRREAEVSGQEDLEEESNWQAWSEGLVWRPAVGE